MVFVAAIAGVVYPIEFFRKKMRQLNYHEVEVSLSR